MFDSDNFAVNLVFNHYQVIIGSDDVNYLNEITNVDYWVLLIVVDEDHKVKDLFVILDYVVLVNILSDLWELKEINDQDLIILI